MNLRNLLIIASFGVVCCAFANDDASTVSPQRKPSKTWWGLEVGVYVPTSAELRDQFNGSMLRVGVAPMTKKFDDNWKVAPDLNFLVAEQDNSRLILVPATIGVSKGFSNGGSKTYISAGTGPAYYDYRLFRGVNEFSDRTFGWNIHMEVGILLTERLAIQGRYDHYSKKDGFDFSGWSITGNFAIFKW